MGGSQRGKGGSEGKGNGKSHHEGKGKKKGGQGRAAIQLGQDLDVSVRSMEADPLPPRFAALPPTSAACASSISSKRNTYRAIRALRVFAGQRVWPKPADSRA